MQDYQKQFLDFVINRQILRFGEFTLKSGRQSPYFFNAGLFNTGAALAFIGQCYAAAIQQAGLEYDVIFGPAYKGIPLAAATSIALANNFACDKPYCFNRKEAKDHGEGGLLIGAPLRGRVIIIDDVISAGTSVKESVSIIRQAGAEPAGVLIALDRQERGGDAVQVTGESAVEQVRSMFGIPVLSIASLDDLIAYLEASPQGGELAAHRDRVVQYRQRYGSGA